MSAHKQQLLKRHRKRKRVILLVVLVVLLLSALWAWWLPPMLAVLLWVAHEAWFSDHLFYVPGSDYQYDLQASERHALRNQDGMLAVPAECVLDGSETLLLRVTLKAGWLGRLFDPAVRIEGGVADCQAFERGVRGVRYLNLVGQAEALSAGRLRLRGRHCRIASDVELLVFRHDDYLAGSMMVIAPHADDAELAAFAAYAQARSSWIVTLTAGEIENEYYRETFGIGLAEAARLKGELRSWDSIAVPRWAGVPSSQCVQLGYFCMQLPAMQADPDAVVASREADLADTRVFRRFNEVALASDADGRPTWSNLVQDLRELIERARPATLVMPHPALDPHPDHVAAHDAVQQALQGSSWQPDTLLFYANHLHDNDRWPMGDAGTGVPLPPFFDAALPMRPWVLDVSAQMQRHKAIALGMMHDLQPAPPFKRRIRRLLQRCLAARRWPAFGDNEFFRKAVRRHELLWVGTVIDKREPR
ncbi:PIG-L family deacetylase [Pseudomonas sp. GD03858]|uniref:PIG-L family deacetylase n=1 Tax=unclassified Pseudomonas TaxID=196821 RepID=UPI00244BBA4C|nr:MULTISPECIES: PIG-L family deacetylase [unclassified Pseudomonas]MDH0648003.1 PIG-L family deacetylase [Pseudomonas sp. GD03867]MDH0665671.1 PIG-L family deacetylase [Pseudomonas sp. GD03858]